MTHAQSIELINALDRKFTPELKRPMVDMSFAPGFTQAAYADKLLAEYRAAGIDPTRVFPQSFNPEDIWHWIESHPDFADQALWLDTRGRIPGFQPSEAEFQALRARGLNIIAPPMPVLPTLNDAGEIVAQPVCTPCQIIGVGDHPLTFELEIRQTRTTGYTH